MAMVRHVRRRVAAAPVVSIANATLVVVSVWELSRISGRGAVIGPGEATVVDRAQRAFLHAVLVNGGEEVPRSIRSTTGTSAAWHLVKADTAALVQPLVVLEPLSGDFRVRLVVVVRIRTRAGKGGASGDFAELVHHESVELRGSMGCTRAEEQRHANRGDQKCEVEPHLSEVKECGKMQSRKELWMGRMRERCSRGERDSVYMCYSCPVDDGWLGGRCHDRRL